MTNFPVASTIVASEGIVMFVPTAAIFPSRSSTVAPRSAGPFMVRTVPEGEGAAVAEPLALHDRIDGMKRVQNAGLPESIRTPHHLFLETDAHEEGHADDVDVPACDLVGHLVRLGRMVKREIESEFV